MLTVCYIYGGIIQARNEQSVSHSHNNPLYYLAYALLDTNEWRKGATMMKTMPRKEDERLNEQDVYMQMTLRTSHKMCELPKTITHTPDRAAYTVTHTNGLARGSP